MGNGSKTCEEICLSSKKTCSAGESRSAEQAVSELVLRWDVDVTRMAGLSIPGQVDACKGKPWLSPLDPAVLLIHVRAAGDERRLFPRLRTRRARTAHSRL